MSQHYSVPKLADCTALEVMEQYSVAGRYYNAISKHKDVDKKIEMYNQLIEQFADHVDVLLHEIAAKSLLNKGHSLGDLGRPYEQIAIYKQLITRFGDSAAPTLQKLVIFAMFTKAFILGDLGQSRQAIIAYDRLIERFGHHVDLTLQQRVADAMYSKGYVFNQIGNSLAEISAYDQLINTFHDSTDLGIREKVAKARLKKGHRLGELGRPHDQILAYDQVISGFSEPDDLSIHQAIAQALFKKGEALDRLGYLQEKIAVYDQMINYFGRESSKSRFGQRAAYHLAVVALAQNGHGFTRLIQAKSYWYDRPLAEGLLHHAREDIISSLNNLALNGSRTALYSVGVRLGNLAYVEFLLSDLAPAVTHLREALEKGGETLYRATLDDIAMHPIAPDAEFKALLERVWQSINPS